MSASIVEPHGRMRARDVNRVAKREQAPRPETNTSFDSSNQMQRCYQSYYDYHKCIQDKGTEAQECKKVAEYYKSMCPDWIENWRIE